MQSQPIRGCQCRRLLLSAPHKRDWKEDCMKEDIICKRYANLKVYH
jgi:hypothetical protein